MTCGDGGFWAPSFLSMQFLVAFLQRVMVVPVQDCVYNAELAATIKRGQNSLHHAHPQIISSQECVYGAAGALAEASKGGPGACAAAQRASDIGRSTALLVAAVAGGNPKHARTAFSLRLDKADPANAAPPPQSAWARVAQFLHLSPVQCRVRRVLGCAWCSALAVLLDLACCMLSMLT